MIIIYTFIYFILLQINSQNNFNNNKSSTTSIKKSVERFLIVRSIKYNKQFIGIILLNSYDIKNRIEAYFAKPATAFIKYEEFQNILEDNNNEKNKFKEMSNNNFNNEEPTDNLYFLTSLKDNEISSMKLKSNFAGFQLITYLGLKDVNIDKFHRDSINHDRELNTPINEKLFESDLNKTAEDLLIFLRNYCEETKKNPIVSQYNNYYYSLIIQRRTINDLGITKFEKLLNLSTRIHRYSPIKNSIIENNDSF